MTQDTVREYVEARACERVLWKATGTPNVGAGPSPAAGA
jgi:hypothetical protein